MLQWWVFQTCSTSRLSPLQQQSHPSARRNTSKLSLSEVGEENTSSQRNTSAFKIEQEVMWLLGTNGEVSQQTLNSSVYFGTTDIVCHPLHLEREREKREQVFDSSIAYCNLLLVSKQRCAYKNGIVQNCGLRNARSTSGMQRSKRMIWNAEAPFSMRISKHFWPESMTVGIHPMLSSSLLVTIRFTELSSTTITCPVRSWHSYPYADTSKWKSSLKPW